MAAASRSAAETAPNERNRCIIAPSSNAADPRPRLSIHWSHQHSKWFIGPDGEARLCEDGWIGAVRAPETPSALNHRGMEAGCVCCKADDGFAGNLDVIPYRRIRGPNLLNTER